MSEQALIEVEKGGEVLHVHPTALADHLRCGWTQRLHAEPQPQQEATEQLKRGRRAATKE
jgi:hypothetical protein